MCLRNSVVRDDVIMVRRPQTDAVSGVVHRNVICYGVIPRTSRENAGVDIVCQ
jgi:hypothetical protein